MDGKLKQLLTWIARNIAAEPLSGMLPYGPVWNVNAVELLDAIAETYGLSKEEVGAVVDPGREKVGAGEGRGGTTSRKEEFSVDKQELIDYWEKEAVDAVIYDWSSDDHGWVQGYALWQCARELEHGRPLDQNDESDEAILDFSRFERAVEAARERAS